MKNKNNGTWLTRQFVLSCACMLLLAVVMVGLAGCAKKGTGNLATTKATTAAPTTKAPAATLPTTAPESTGVINGLINDVENGADDVIDGTTSKGNTSGAVKETTR